MEDDEAYPGQGDADSDNDSEASLVQGSTVLSLFASGFIQINLQLSQNLQYSSKTDLMKESFVVITFHSVFMTYSLSS